MNSEQAISYRFHLISASANREEDRDGYTDTSEWPEGKDN